MRNKGVIETTDKVVLIKEKLKAARDHQKSYAGNRRKPLEFEVRDKVLLKVSPWKGVMQFGKKGKLTPRYVRPFEILERIGPVAYRLRLPNELSEVHDIFHVSNLKKCLADVNLHVPLDEIEVDKTLHFVEKPVEIMDREVKTLIRSKIPIVKVHWNSKCGPEFTWEREDHMKARWLERPLGCIGSSHLISFRILLQEFLNVFISFVVLDLWGTFRPVVLRYDMFGIVDPNMQNERGARVCVRTYLLGGAIDGSEANGIIRDPKLELESSRFTFDLVPLIYESVDVVVRENWLLRHKAEMSKEEYELYVKMIVETTERKIRLHAVFPTTWQWSKEEANYDYGRNANGVKSYWALPERSK
ncbi:hypothetical protein Tco_1410058 [Tanacetum coccineum]